MAEDKKDVNVSLCTGNITPETPLQDELKRLPFAKSIAALIQKNAEGKIVIGIEGEWGEGKTYTIELIRREIETYNKDKNKKEETIAWMVFNPWHFTDRQHLASLFLRDLAVFIEKQTRWKRFFFGVRSFFIKAIVAIFFFVPNSILIEFRKAFLAAFGTVTIISFCDQLISVIRIVSALKKYRKEFKGTEPKNTLETLKKDVTKKLSDKSLPFSQIVVAVEDMDRLNPEEIRAMLQLMKMIADFPKIIYLLGYDRTHVVNALGDLAGHHANRKEAREYGEGYLKKVVQAAYALPAPGEYAIATMTLSDFKKIAKKAGHPDTFDSDEYFKKVWIYLTKLITTLRMGERVVNRALLILLMLRDKCNPADVLVAAYLMEFQPKLWRWLWGPGKDFLKRDGHRFFPNEKDLREKLSPESLDDITKYIEADEKIAQDILHLLSFVHSFKAEEPPYSITSWDHCARYFEYTVEQNNRSAQPAETLQKSSNS